MPPKLTLVLRGKAHVDQQPPSSQEGGFAVPPPWMVTAEAPGGLCVEPGTRPCHVLRAASPGRRRGR